MGLWDSVADWASNADWGGYAETAGKVYGAAKPFINLGQGLYEQGKKNDYVKDYSQYLQDTEQRNYDRYQAEVAALQEGAGIKAGFLEQALAQQGASMEQIMALYKPFIDAAKSQLPQKLALSNQGMEGLGGLFAQINTPEMNANINKIPTSAIAQASLMNPKGIIR